MTCAELLYDLWVTQKRDGQRNRRRNCCFLILGRTVTAVMLTFVCQNEFLLSFSHLLLTFFFHLLSHSLFFHVHDLCFCLFDVLLHCNLLFSSLSRSLSLSRTLVIY